MYVVSSFNNSQLLTVLFCAGICVCGSGVGTFMMAPFMSFLLVHYGWRGCNRIVACLCLACTFFGLMMVPVKKNQQLVEHNNNNDVEQEKKKSCLQLLSEIPFLLMVLANIPNAMAIYISYTYLPYVSRTYY